MAEHGLTMYQRYGCRCDVCREANALRGRRARESNGDLQRVLHPKQVPPMPDAVYEEAACRGWDGDWWFPRRGDANLPVTLFAKHVCHSCPVEDLCLEHALDHEHHGIWGGTSEKERRKLRRQRRLRGAAVSTAGTAVKSPGRTPTAAPGSSTEKRWPRQTRTSWSGDRIA